jgi:outer membrane protein assembly factor BamB
MKPTFIALLALCLCLPLAGADKKKPGTVLWEFKTGDVVAASPAIGTDGTVYIGSFDSKLYAIKTHSKGPANSPWPMRGQNAQHTGRAPKK